MKTIIYLALCLSTFFLFSCATNSVLTDYFNDKVSTGDDLKENYLVKNDGSKIYGNKIDWQGGLLMKKMISIDGHAYKTEEIRGYKSGKEFYGRLGGSYIKRIIQGKINVYVSQYTQRETSSATGIERNVTHSSHYYQKGDDGKITILSGNQEFKRAVEDCPLAVAMINKSVSDIRKAV